MARFGAGSALIEARLQDRISALESARSAGVVELAPVRQHAASHLLPVDPPDADERSAARFTARRVRWAVATGDALLIGEAAERRRSRHLLASCVLAVVACGVTAGVGALHHPAAHRSMPAVVDRGVRARGVHS